ncbi:DUF3775 domain-containing protein [Mesorhizobium sp. B2-4-13]|uniref:DUF3775 domain-containing protein n=1 Tax=Mesorhizobium sp. B2-4-13 TaxID=2589936 RepID=UPI001150FAB0|nr:DUF3775 domain-containing protein [Mesorhizobium sp. B2-4-13]TPK84169.1 DUF3775 domain-containing protein [Mesorhizobium sp. B2-4-13]
MTNVTTPIDPSAEPFDPFFSQIYGSEWNACVGSQGSAENYVDGYMEAALELASAVIDQRQYGKRDTLAMPILYNARHAVELSLKFVIDRLVAAGVVSHPHPKNHDIKSHWTMITNAPLGDMELRKHVADLSPFVDSLHDIDEDGQQLRYAETQDGDKSLGGKSICNLELVRASLLSLNKTLLAMKYRAIDLVYERATGSFTASCSRRDLLRMAGMLPPPHEWSEAAFTTAKTQVMEQFGIGSRKFSDAVSIIKGHREAGSLVGFEFKLAHLTDEHAKFVIEEWIKAHPATDRGEFDYFNRDWDRFRKSMGDMAAAVKSVTDTLSPEEIADLETIFYIGRERMYCEGYDEQVKATLSEHRVAGNLMEEVRHLLTKTNLLDALVRGTEILGRRRLASELRALRPAVTAD